jgi:hypothetical protein
MTTDTDAVPMLNRHGRAAWEMACTVKRGVVPVWYQPWGDERRSVTCPGAQARARAASWGGVALGRGDARESGRGDGDVLAGVVSRLTGTMVGPAVAAPPDGWVWSAVERAASIPFAAHPRLVSNPMPTARTVTRRRQYVACEGLGGGVRAPRRASGLPR